MSRTAKGIATGRAGELTWAIVGTLLSGAPALAGGCKISKLVEFPITMVGLQPLLTAGVNDAHVQFVLDSGAFYSMISPASAAELKLKLSPAPFGFSVIGVHGGANVSIATVKTLTLAGIPLPNVDFLAGGSEAGQESVGLLGQNVLHVGDVEYDLGQGVVRLIKAQDCRGAFLAYWVGSGKPYSKIDLTPDNPLGYMKLSHTIGYAYVNGAKIRVTFDTGAGTSILSLSAAARAGIRPDSPGVVRGGTIHGVGRETFETYIAPFASFKIGDEEIRNTRLRIGDIDTENSDMLIGADFFLSHRVYVANSQDKLYFTYNGGPVFNLSAGKPALTTSATAAASPAPAEAAAASEDAGDYARRGAAFASRREFDQALSALSRACELAPDNADYFYQRGTVYWETQQADSAMADFDQALKLQPNHLRALLRRAELQAIRGESDRALADLDAADAIAPKEANDRFEMALAYQRADRLASAILQLNLWIASHADDALLPTALNNRCWLRALQNAELPLALKDCNSALRGTDKASARYAQVADSRGLVYLRMGAYDKSIADYDASLKANPKNAWSLYGRGIDKLRKNEGAAGNADIAQATAVSPRIANEFHRRGIDP